MPSHDDDDEEGNADMRMSMSEADLDLSTYADVASEDSLDEDDDYDERGKDAHESDSLDDDDELYDNANAESAAEMIRRVFERSDEMIRDLRRLRAHSCCLQTNHRASSECRKLAASGEDDNHIRETRGRLHKGPRPPRPFGQRKDGYASFRLHIFIRLILEEAYRGRHLVVSGSRITVRWFETRCLNLSLHRRSRSHHPISLVLRL